MTDAKPYSKEAQLARGPRRYRRKVASPKQWQAIAAAKQGPCRVCTRVENGRVESRITFHHIVPRDWHGDDVADNLVPVCLACHERLHDRSDFRVALLLCSHLTDAEYAYAVGKAGESWAERIYGVEYER